MTNTQAINKKIKATRRLMFVCMSGLVVVTAGFGLWRYLQAPAPAYADSAGPRSATSTSDCVNDASIGTAAWTSPGNAYSSDGSSASYSTTSTSAVATQYLKCTNFGFTGLIPTGSTITGIVATVGKSKGSFGNAVDNAVRIVKGGVIGSTDKKSATAWQLSISPTTYGGSSDLWGQTWAISDITASNFGIAFSASVTGQSFFSGQANVDYMQLTVYFTAPPVTVTQAGYRLYANINSTDVGSPLAGLNTAKTLTSTGQEFRLRTLLNVATNPLLTTKSFKLQYVDQGTGSCASPSGGTPSSYTDISTGGTSWSQPGTLSALSGSNGGRPVTSFNGYMWYPGSGVATMYYSNNGSTWSSYGSMPWTPRAGEALIVYNNKLWLFGGQAGSTFYHDVWYSSDGQNWTQATSAASWSARSSFGVAVYNNAMWIFGGLTGTNTVVNDIWYSTDGSTWTQATSSAAWSARSGTQAVQLGSTLYLLGGIAPGTSTLYQEVWTSTDGTNWSQGTTPSWSARSNMGTTILGGKIWMAGGQYGTNTNQRLNDVWYSADGSSWTQVTSAASWSTRMNMGFLTYNNALWLLGGEDGSGSTDTDVWTSAGSTNITWKDNSTPTSGSALTTDSNDPTDSGNTIVAQTYQEGNPAATTTQVPVGQDGMWDWSLVDNDPVGGTTYCFRMVYSDGTALDTYSYYPQITTYTPPTEPLKIKGGVKLRGGVKFIR